MFLAGHIDPVLLGFFFFFFFFFCCFFHSRQNSSTCVTKGCGMYCLVWEIVPHEKEAEGFLCL